MQHRTMTGREQLLGVINLKRLRIISIVLAAVIALPINAISAPANAAVTFVNTIPIVDPNLSALVNGGVIGDKIRFTLTNASGTVSVKFTGSNSVTASAVPGVAGTYEVVVPVGTTTGAVTVTYNGKTDTAGTFQVWNTHGEPYVMPAGHLNVTYNDLQFILDQIKMAEAHADRTSAGGKARTSIDGTNSESATRTKLSVGTAQPTPAYPYDVTSATRCLTVDDVETAANNGYGSTNLSGSYIWTAEDPLGLRTVNGECNNISRVM
ncbi:MAG: hypothetical protein WCJ83_04770, partial [Actinomycetes bacterium]